MGFSGVGVGLVLQAVELEDRDGLERLLAQRPTCSDDDDDLVAPLHLAARLSALQSIHVLLCAGAPASLLDGQGWSCLHHLAVSEADSACRVSALQALCSAGADADRANPSGQTPLHLAAKSGADELFLTHLLLMSRDSGACDVRQPHSTTHSPLRVLGSAVPAPPRDARSLARRRQGGTHSTTWRSRSHRPRRRRRARRRRPPLGQRRRRRAAARQPRRPRRRCHLRPGTLTLR